MRFALVLALIVTALTAPAALAGDRAAAPLPDRAFSGPGWRFRDVENFREQYRQDQQRVRRAGDRPFLVVPQVVFVSPGRCWQTGYWDYQWVEQSYWYDAWVPGAWSSDGFWIERHYEPAWYSGGYYQPYWVDGVWSRC